VTDTLRSRATVAPAGEDRAARAFMATQNREERQRSSVYTTAETILGPGRTRSI
jgi:hypothetical protein